jgi:hypothetical protein
MSEYKIMLTLNSFKMVLLRYAINLSQKQFPCARVVVVSHLIFVGRIGIANRNSEAVERDMRRGHPKGNIF